MLLPASRGCLHSLACHPFLLGPQKIFKPLLNTHTHTPLCFWNHTHTHTRTHKPLCFWNHLFSESDPPASLLEVLVISLTYPSNPTLTIQSNHSILRPLTQLTLVVFSGESHGQQSLAGCSPWGHKESDTTEQLTLSQLNHTRKSPLPRKGAYTEFED